MKRYSLTTLLILITLTAMGMGYFFTRAQIEKTQIQIDLMRHQFSLLDPVRPAAIKAISLRRNRLGFDYSWRISLPKGGRFAIRMAVEDIPKEDVIPDVFSTVAEVVAGEYYLSLDADHWRDEGRYHFRLEDVAGGAVSDFKGTVSDFSWLRVPYGQKGSIMIEEKGTTFGEADDPFPLLKIRKGTPEKRKVIENPAPCLGILVWIEKIG